METTTKKKSTGAEAPPMFAPPSGHPLAFALTCTFRAPLYATLAAFAVQTPLQWLVEALGWTPLTTFIVVSIAIHEGIFGMWLCLSWLKNNTRLLARYTLPRTKAQRVPLSSGQFRSVLVDNFYQHVVQQPVVLYLCFLNYADPQHIQNPLRPLDRSFLQVYACFFMLQLGSEFATYILHRALHHPSIYPYMHKSHHVYKGAEVWGAEYASFVEHFLGTVGPVQQYCSGEDHQIIWFVWVAWQVWQSSEQHSGLCFASTWPNRYFGLLHGHRARFHEHHHAVNIGVYGSSTLSDYVFGTMGNYLTWQPRLTPAAAVDGADDAQASLLPGQTSS